jgi:hypothetical protein
MEDLDLPHFGGIFLFLIDLGRSLSGVRPEVEGITRSRSALSYCLTQPLLLVMPLTFGLTLHIMH